MPASPPPAGAPRRGPRADSSAAGSRRAAAGSRRGAAPGDRRAPEGARRATAGGAGQRPNAQPPNARRRPVGPPPRPRRRLWRPLALLLSVPLLGVGAVAVGMFFYLFTALPLPDDIGEQATVVYDVEGREIGELQPQAGREDVALAALPEHVVDAVLAAEDARFYDHHGVSLPGVVRAAVANVVAGDVRQGGSTISQQYLKNHTADTDQTLLRKVREAVLAVKLEQSYSKDEILELYLNSIYFGRGAYGIEAAAQAYFGVGVIELDRAQAVQLAGILPAPSAYDPAENPDAASRRYRYVVDRLVEEQWITTSEAGRLAAEPPETVAPRPVAAQEAPFFLDHVQHELAQRVGDDLVYRGLEVHTTLDLDTQASAEAAHRDGFADVEPSGALVSLDPDTGGIRAMVGGKDHTADQLNLALAPRQPGSTFKPLALAAWVEDGRSVESRFPAPAEEEFDTGEEEPWRVRNYGGTGYGSQTVREATWRSTNTVYAQLALEVGPRRVADLAARAGIQRSPTGNPSIVLGTGDVSPLELAGAYNTFAAGGVHRQPMAITSVERDGEFLFEATDRDDRAFDADVAWTVTEVLEGVITNGTGQAAAIGRPAAGKTGTTQGHGDAWFAGYTPALTTVVWMGNRDSNAPMAGEPTGGGLPAQVWAAHMRSALADVPAEDFPEPSGDLERTDHVPDCPDGEVAEDGECVPVTPEPDEGPVVETPDGEPTEPVEPSEPAEPAEPTEPAPPSPEPSAPPPTIAPTPAPSPTSSPPPEPPSSPRPSPTAAPAPPPTPTPAAEPADAQGGAGAQSPAGD